MLFFCLFPHCSASGHVYVAKTLSTGKKVAIKETGSLSWSTTKGAYYRERDLGDDEGIATPLYYQLLFFLESHLVKSNELWLWVVNGVYGGWCIIENNICGWGSQISGICLEVSISFDFIILVVEYVLIFFFLFKTCKGMAHSSQDWYVYFFSMKPGVTTNPSLPSFSRFRILRQTNRPNVKNVPPWSIQWVHPTGWWLPK